MVISTKIKGDKIHPDCAEDQLRYEEFFEILFQADKRRLEELVVERIARKSDLDKQIEVSDRKIIRRKLRDPKRNII